MSPRTTSEIAKELSAQFHRWPLGWEDTPANGRKLIWPSHVNADQILVWQQRMQRLVSQLMESLKEGPATPEGQAR